MKKHMGLWIDHRQAVIVNLMDGMEEVKRIMSNIEKRVRYSGTAQPQAPTAHNDTAEDKRDRRYDEHLNKYYDEVSAVLQGADSILILGPGEAKVELKKRLEGQKVSNPVVTLETTDKMTDGQIAAEIRRHFRG